MNNSQSKLSLMSQKKETHSQHEASGGSTACSCDQRSRGNVSNEYVLNIAFYSFIGFTACQFVFAILAESQAMVADSEAMSIDALTYLFNMCAEQIKNQPISTENNRDLSVSEKEYKRNLRRLYLELFPPMISVLCLFAVTVTTIREASHSLWAKNRQSDEDVSLSIMLAFSALNLLLDAVNVSCFARANMNFGLDIVRKEADDIKETVRRRFSGDANGLPTETSSLLLSLGQKNDEPVMEKDSDSINLNMCSAWTHVCADTLRSTAVLIAAGMAYVFPAISPSSADSVAAIIVSIIIFLSLIPLIQGLCITAFEMYRVTRHPPTSAYV